jgi:hypothetical protein
MESGEGEKKMSETIYMGVADTARLLRKELKSKFPGIKFSVRSDSYSGGASINVRYNGAGGGPIGSDVEAVATFFASGGFDGSIDLAYGKYHYMLPDGSFIVGRSSGTAGSGGYVEGWKNEMPEGAVEVHFGATFIFVRDEGPPRHRENCEWSDMTWCPGGGCTRGIPRREEDVIYGEAVPFYSFG